MPLATASWVATVLACGRFEDLVVPPFGPRRRATRLGPTSASDAGTADDVFRARLARLLLPPWHAAVDFAPSAGVGTAGEDRGGSHGASADSTPEDLSRSDQEIEDAIFAVAGECGRDGPAGGDVEGPSVSGSSSAASGGVGRPMPRDAIPLTVEDPDAVGRGAEVAPESIGRLGDDVDGGGDAGRPSGPPGAGIEVADETDGGTPPSHKAAAVERANCDRGGADGGSRRPHEEGEEIEPDAHPAVTRVQNAHPSANAASKPMDREEELECSSERGEECTAGQNGTADDSSLDESRFAGAPLMLGVASWLPAFYSVAVHVFLSIPNERTLTALRHWRPVAVRVAYGALAASCGGVRLSPGRTGPGDIALIASVVAISAILLLKTRREEVDGPVPPHTSMEGRVVLVTGSNAGIGKETARQLYERGATVVFGCRSRARALAAMEDIDPAHSEGQENRRMVFVELDLARLASVRRAAAEFLSLELPLHVLILNAGLMRSRREVTEDGLEMTLAANVVGHFLLADLLLPRLRETAEADGESTRVITVSSSLYANARRGGGGGGTVPGLDLDDLQCARGRYGLFDRYAQTKLANVLFSQELGRRERLRVGPPPDGAPLTPEGPTKRSSKTRLTPIEGPDNVFGDDLFGNFAVVSSPSTSTPPKKMRRPRLTPVPSNITSSSDDESSSSSEDELGFEEIATPSTTPSPSPQKKNRKRLVPIPLDSDSDDDDGIGLGYDDVMPSPKSIEKATALTCGDRVKVRPAAVGTGYPVRSFCLHPGLVRTDVVRDMPWYLYYPNGLLSVFVAALQKTPRSGAYTSVHCATADCGGAPEAGYFVNSKPQPLREWACDADDAKGLWEKLSAMSS